MVSGETVSFGVLKNIIKKKELKMKIIKNDTTYFKF